MKRLALALLLASPAAAQEDPNVLINAGFQNGLANWYETGPGNTYNGCGPAGGICYVFSYSTGVVQQAVALKTANPTSFTFSFDYLMDCNNSIGGYCQNPNGPKDWLRATLYLYGDNDTSTSYTALDTTDYFTSYRTVTLAEQLLNFSTTSAAVKFEGRDAGYWAGPYGPKIDRVSLTFDYTVTTPDPPPIPETPTVNCQTTPDAPECVQTYSPVDVTPDTTVAAVETPQEETTTIVAEVPVEETTVAAEPTVEEPAAEETVVVSETTEAAVSETVAEPERLSPDEVLALAASEPQEDAPEATAEPMAEQPTEASAAASAPPEAPSAVNAEAQAATETAAPAQSDNQPVSAAVETAETSRPEVVSERTQVEEASQPERVTPITVADAEQAVTEELHSGMAVAVAEPERVTVEVAQPQQDDMSSPSSQAVTMELLSNSMPETNAAPEMAQMTNGSNDAMVELAVAPAGYGSYSQARIPDVPFYAPKDIYKNRKVPDAYWELYRMMRSQDTAWNAMVEDQYER